MPKVFATWVMTVHPGMEEEFERFLHEEGLPRQGVQGARLRILKGERGEGLGKYLMMNEFESVETRDRYFPSRTQASKEGEEAMQSEPVQRFLSFIQDRVDTDWIVLFEQQ
jgi:hypothetical protein